MKTPLTPEQAQARLEDLCSRSEQCTADLRRKLRLWGIDSSDADGIIDSLIDNKFVDDARFARAYVADKYRFSSWGRRKIRAGLLAKSISRPLIDEAIESIDNALYQRRAFDAMKARLRTLDRSDTTDCRQRLLRFGLSRGYETELLLRILNSRSLWLTSAN